MNSVITGAHSNGLVAIHAHALQYGLWRLARSLALGTENLIIASIWLLKVGSLKLHLIPSFPLFLISSRPGAPCENSYSSSSTLKLTSLVSSFTFIYPLSSSFCSIYLRAKNALPQDIYFWPPFDTLLSMGRSNWLKTLLLWSGTLYLWWSSSSESC